MADSAQTSASNADTDYERREIPLRPLAFVALGLFVFLGIAPLIILVGFPVTAHDVDRRVTVVPPEPRLQIHPRADLEAYLSKEHELLDTYGWADRAHGIARIPVGEAMRRAVQQGIAGFPKMPAATGRPSGEEPP